MQAVGLVEHQQRVLLLDADLLQHLVDRRDLVAHGRIADVGHVQQQVRLPRFLQRRLETGDQAVRQLADEPHRVAQQHRAPVRQLPAPRARVERGEQLVLDQHVRVGQRVHQRALAGIRVADQRHRHVARRGPPPAAPCASRSPAARCAGRGSAARPAAGLPPTAFRPDRASPRPASCGTSASTSA